MRCNRAMFQQAVSQINSGGSITLDDKEGLLEAKPRCFESRRKFKFATYQHRTATRYDAPRANPSIVEPGHLSSTSTHSSDGSGSPTKPPSELLALSPNSRPAVDSVGLNVLQNSGRLPRSPRPRSPALRAVSSHSSSTDTVVHSVSQNSVIGCAASDYEDEGDSTHYSERKREFAVAFSPDTVDSSPWGGDGPPTKRVHTPTPHPVHSGENGEEEPKEDDDVSRLFLNALSPSVECDQLERPPQKDSSPPVTTKPEAEESREADNEDSSDVFIVITSPTGERRVWGVSETIATQVSQMLDHKQDELLAERTRGRSPIPFTAGKKRKLEVAPEEQGRSTLVKKFDGLVSRFLG